MEPARYAMAETERRNPDELLADVQREEARARRGRLRMFFGASAGVGKTYSMLEAARAARAGWCGHRRRLRRTARACRNRALARGARAAAVPRGPLPRHRSARVRSRRRSTPRAGDRARRRASALECRRRRAAAPARQALARRRGAARCGHQRLDDAQRPALGELERRRRAASRAFASRRRFPIGYSTRRTKSS